MAVLDLAYAELYVANETTAVSHLVDALGFTPVAYSQEPDRRSVLLRQGEAELVVTTGQSTEAFLGAHGDGVADLVLTCDDVEATVAAARTAGAVIGTERGRPVVSGFGGVRHTLLPASHGLAAPLPEDRHWEPCPPVTGRRHQHVQLLDHVAVCLGPGTVEQVADYYRDAFGFSRFSGEYVALGAQAMDSIVVRSDSGRVTLTLVASAADKERGQLDAFLERNAGPGVQHLAFLVDDILAAVPDQRANGVEFLSTPATYYELLGERITEMRGRVDELRNAQVLADRDEWGYLLQIFTRSPHDRNTLFYELIQRHGSRGFGSANIRALYEAVERDRLNVG